MSRPELSPQQRTQFEETGYLRWNSLFSDREMELLHRIARRDRVIEEAATTRSDASGASTVLAVQDQLGDDMCSAIARSARVVETAAQLIGEEVYHYHHKLMLKEPRVGGAWEWHQDYGYWYNYGCLYPRMLSCYVAIDRATRRNGCLQVIPGSHSLGRLEHGKVGGQTGVDQERIDAILARLPLQHVEMEPGDALFFHGNLLHRSDKNTSDDPRWSLICCYNARSNSPYREIRHNAYRPLEVLADGEIERVGTRQLAQLERAAPR
jgi:ectoine hydroxylase-related dioxygenase (phytanoyl-CoA dioxygenase family)